MVRKRQGGRAPSDFPRVSARQAAPPGAPDCPACGDPLFGWIEADEDGVAADRCENCGLIIAVGGRGAEPEAIRGVRSVAAALRAGEESEIAFSDAGSIQAMFGAGRWAGLGRQPGAAELSSGAVERILADEGLELTSRRPQIRCGIGLMWQTLVNLVTFTSNFAPRALSRRLRPDDIGVVKFSIDSAITVLIAAPVLILAVVMEGLAIAFGRGGAVEIRFARAMTSRSQ